MVVVVAATTADERCSLRNRFGAVLLAFVCHPCNFNVAVPFKECQAPARARDEMARPTYEEWTNTATLSS
ncbi:hypothetical protein POTOM_008743 [Populus tomentosa]|uniref:Uncharacterized protein n=1 Tax=Populus tomentosa TaxID=118781 RepID=A0A8X8AHY2_POPTO|nr:hypothetical protein POTOM_008743 [Populus tomentosa]